MHNFRLSEFRHINLRRLWLTSGMLVLGLALAGGLLLFSVSPAHAASPSGAEPEKLKDTTACVVEQEGKVIICTGGQGKTICKTEQGKTICKTERGNTICIAKQGTKDPQEAVKEEKRQQSVSDEPEGLGTIGDGAKGAGPLIICRSGK